MKNEIGTHCKIHLNISVISVNTIKNTKIALEKLDLCGLLKCLDMFSLKNVYVAKLKYYPFFWP